MHLVWVCGFRFNAAPTNEVAMRMLRCIILAAATILALTPATAQRYDPRYPVCFEGKLGASSIIDCSYTSMDQCRMTAAGLSATCYANPYWSQASQPSPGRASRRHGRLY
jgi:Protein of unknown function (DUF3551)